MSTGALPDFAVLVDLEASAAIDLKRHGAYVVAEHPGTRLLCLAAAVVRDGIVGPVIGVDALTPEPLPGTVLQALVAGAAVISWGDYDRILLEWAGIGAAVGWPATLAPVWLSGIDIAAAANMPASLDACAKAVGLDLHKDPFGARLIRRYCKPDSQGHVEDIATVPLDRMALTDYCRNDVTMMAAVLAALPPLSVREGRIAAATWRMNCRGVRIDRDLAEGLARWDDWHRQRLEVEAAQSHGINIRSQPQLLRALAIKGFIPPVSRKTGRPTLGRKQLARCAPPQDPFLQDLLRLHEENGDSSLKKARAALERTCRDGRARGLFVYGGTRTMRWSSRALQLQNLPRPAFKMNAADMAALARLFSSHQPPDIIADTLRLIWPERPGTLAVSALRGLLVPETGTSFAVADLKSIELLTNFGAAGIDDGLTNIAAGRDEYRLFIDENVLPAIDRAIGGPHQDNGRVLLEQARADIAGHARDYGKRALLSMQYGSGEAGLAAQMNVPADIAALLRNSYLQRYPRMVTHWAALQEAAIITVSRDETHRLDHSDVRFRMNRSHATPYLEMVRPSGEALRYPFPEVTEHARGAWRCTNLSTMVFEMDGRKTRAGFRRDVKPTEFPEHVASSIARDLLAEAFLAADSAGLAPVALIHDEIICESADLSQLLAIMRAKPKWCPPAWPVDAEGALLDRYRKI